MTSSGFFTRADNLKIQALVDVRSKQYQMQRKTHKGEFGQNEGNEGRRSGNTTDTKHDKRSRVMEVKTRLPCQCLSTFTFLLYFPFFRQVSWFQGQTFDGKLPILTVLGISFKCTYLTKVLLHTNQSRFPGSSFCLLHATSIQKTLPSSSILNFLAT